MKVRNIVATVAQLEYKSVSIENHEDIIYISRQDGYRINGYDEPTKPCIPEAILDREVEQFDITVGYNDEVWLSILTPDYIGDEQYH